MERIHVRVDQPIKHELDAEARHRGVNPSEIVREALEEHIRRQPPRLDARQLAEKLGILGHAKGLPADLSTNPEHMKGFGE